MKKTMLTYRTLDRFEREYNFNEKDVEGIEFAAYVANMNTCNNPYWTQDDIFRDFLRVLKIHKVDYTEK